MRRPAITPLASVASFRNFLRDKTYFLVAATVLTIIAALFLNGFRVRIEICIMLGILWLIFLIVVLIIEYYRKRNFYQNLLTNLERLDQAYLVLETLSRPRFYDGKVLYAALYRINKSMSENINLYRSQAQEFQEYVEMWIHEVKTPLATLALLSHDPKVSEQIKRLDDYVEQILYFVRAENAERDYLIKATNLANVVGTVASRNREILLAKKIDLDVSNLNYDVQTDAKWLEFILNQIINNSIKYRSRHIMITTHTQDEKVALIIKDDGIGIDVKDLPRVFDKSFTGDNGRLGKKSTGMGLYIAKTLCDKLGHQISISSTKSEYTAVEITFAATEYYEVIDDTTYKNVINS